MGGLGCALSLAKKGFKHIDVYENASNLGFVGAGIQLAPNMIRILDRLGCWEGIFSEATNVKETSIRRRFATNPSRNLANWSHRGQHQRGIGTRRHAGYR